MNPIKERKVKVEIILSSIKRIIEEEAVKQQSFIADLNRQQLLSGKKADGKNMPNYAASSKKSGKITLFERGDLHEGIEPMFIDGGFDNISTDEKFDFLKIKFPESFGLNLDSQKKLRARMMPNIIKRVRELL